MGDVYYFVKGHGTMELDDKKIKVDPGDVVLIEDGAYPVLVNKVVILFVCLTEKDNENRYSRIWICWSST